MKFFKNYFLLLLVGFVFIAYIFFNRQSKQYYPTQEIASFAQAQELLNQCGPNALVLFDVDDVLITSPDYIARGHLPKELKTQIAQAFSQLSDADTLEEVYSLLWQKPARVLIEPQVTTIINNLKQQGALVIGLTSMESGSYGVIADMPKWRADMLKNMGISFTQKYPNQIYTQLKEYRNNYPVLYEGILCTNQQPKGDVLAAFLDANNVHPQLIVFFDDGLKNLESVGECCKKRGIAYRLFHYKGFERFSSALDLPLIMKQVEMLINEHRWVSDQEIIAA